MYLQRSWRTCNSITLPAFSFPTFHRIVTCIRCIVVEQVGFQVLLPDYCSLGPLAPPWPLFTHTERLSKAQPSPHIQTTHLLVLMTFDIGLGEQHTLNCLRQRGTWKASWDGLGKYTEFYPAIGTMSSNITSKCDLCCQMKDTLLSFCWPL